MQNCPHCARSVDDLACACDHCGASLVDPPIGDVFREIDLKLVDPGSVDAVPTADVPSPIGAGLDLPEQVDLSATKEPADELDIDLAALLDAEAAPAEELPRTFGTSSRASLTTEPSLPTEPWHDAEPTLAEPLHVEMFKSTEAPHELESELASPLHLEVASMAGTPRELETPVTSPVHVEISSLEELPQMLDADLPAPLTLNASSRLDAPHPTTSRSPSVAAAPTPARQATAHRPWKHWKIAAAGASLAVVGVVTVMGRPSIPPPAQGVPVTSVPSPSKAAKPARPTQERPTLAVALPEVRPSAVATPDPADIPVTTAPKWARTRQAGWATDGSKTVSFEVEAETEVRVFMKHVRPVLTVRCVGHQTDVFVVTDSAMSIEPTPDQHTVHIGFDGQPPADQRWLDSSSKRELFAPAGSAMALQLAHTHVMRFGFTPYGAAPVVVDFDVHGFAAPLETLTKACGREISRTSRSQRQ